jgi:hypothetical protein
MPSQVVKVSFDPAQLSALDRDATIQGISRAELIRNRTLTRSTGSRTLTTADYHRLVSDAAAFTHGSLDRRQLESVVAFTVNRLLG